MFIGRQDILDNLKEWENDKKIKILIGLRRVGKTYILKEYIKNISHNKINYDFNDPKLNNLSYMELYDKIISQSSSNDTNFVFLDEIQEIKNWEKCVIGLFEHKTIKFNIFLTGSNSHMYSSELRTLLSGRKIEFIVYPLEYNEILEFNNKISFNNYLQNGGLGDILKNYDDIKKTKINLTEIFNDTIQKDIIERKNIKNIFDFKKVLNFALKTIGKKLNSENIVNYLISNGEKSISKPTILNYYQWICDSMVMNKVKYFDIKTKSELSNKAKYYCGDLGLYNVVNGFDIEDSNRSIRIENVVFLFLKKCGYEIFCFEDKQKHEIDFVIKKDNIIKYIQVCEVLNDDNYERETRSLLAVRDGFEKIIICCENNLNFKSLINNGIKIIDLINLLKRKVVI
ncbi:MAG: ATP-binding protein [Mycoplasmataceae bacterium]|nr:ATP-binding protein [Mycoplasmataceae bacterium]